MKTMFIIHVPSVPSDLFVQPDLTLGHNQATALQYNDFYAARDACVKLGGINARVMETLVIGG